MTSASRTITRFAHWALIGVVVLMGAALVATLWSTNRGVHDASETLLRAQAQVYHGALRSQTRRGRSVTPEQLAELIEEHTEDGLRYVALYSSDGALQVEAGEPSDDSRALGGRVVDVGTNTPERIGSRVRVVTGSRRGRRPPWTVIEFEPTAVDDLRDEADRSLGLGALVSGVLLIVSVLLVRWYVRREALERQLEHERRLAHLGQMSAVLAHEIRNPIASLKGNSQLLVKMLPDDDKPRNKAQRVVDESIRLEHLTNDLLEFARAGEITRTSVDPAEILRKAAAHLDASRIEIDASKAPRRFPLDRDRMVQVLSNLLDNALQAGDGAVTATAKTAGGRLVYEIRDRGDGIEPDDLDHIFEPFYTRKTRGTGLGLAVSRRMVELHDGTITASNAPDGGALFRVTLPES